MVGGLDRGCSWRAHAGKTVDEARDNLIDAIHMIQETVDLSKLPKGKVVVEEIEV